MIRFFCPTCGAKVQAPHEKAGVNGSCPKCAGAFTVPATAMAHLQVAAPPTTPAVEIPTPPPPAPEHNELLEAPLTQIEAPLTQVEAPLTEAPMRPGVARSAGQLPNFREVDEEPVDSSQIPPRKFHPLTLAMAAAFALVVVITVVKLFTGPSGIEGSTQAPRQLKTPWLTFVPSDESRPTAPKVRAEPIALDLRPAANKSAFSPSAIRPQFEERMIFDPPPKIKNDTTRPLTPAREFTTTPVIAAPVAVDKTVYVGALDGQLYGINSESMKIVEQKKFDLMLQRLILRGSKLVAEPKGRFRTTLIDFGRVVEVPDPEDAEPVGKFIAKEGLKGPQTWVFGPTERVVEYQGKYYSTDIQKVSVMEGKTSIAHHSHVPDLARWRIALLPSGPLGYDNTSVYQLDENLCPTRRLIDVNADKNEPRNYFVQSWLASNGKTLCFVTTQKEFARMTIWSLDGKEKLRECDVTTEQPRNYQGQPFTPPERRLFAVGDGYVYCGSELTWMPAGQGDVLRFLPQPPKKLVALDGRARRNSDASRDPRKNLTPPLILGDKIFVASEIGGIFILDAAQFSTQSAVGGEP